MSDAPQRRKLVISFDDEPSAERLPTAVGSRVESVDVSLHPQPGTGPDQPPPAAPWPAPAASWPAPAPAPAAASRDWAPPPTPRVLPAAADDRALASWGRRAAAMIVDTLIIWALSIPVVAVFFLLAANSIGGLIAAYLMWSAVPSLAAMVYFPLMLARTGERNGQTLGKQALGVRVVSTAAAGPDVGTGQAALREIVVRQFLFAWLGALLLWIPVLLDVLWPLWHPERRALHDLAASTIVVRDDA